MVAVGVLLYNTQHLLTENTASETRQRIYDNEVNNASIDIIFVIKRRV